MFTHFKGNKKVEVDKVDRAEHTNMFTIPEGEQGIP
jgi:hypothetical protein